MDERTADTMAIYFFKIILLVNNNLSSYTNWKIKVYNI